MTNKTNSHKKEIKLFPAIGMVLMSLASVAGFFEFSSTNGHLKNLNLTKTTVLPMQTVLRAEPAFNSGSNQIYREKEDATPEYVAYNQITSTAPRASKY